VPSFTRIGPALRAKLFDWRPIASYDLTGKVVVITGATSGIGRNAAEHLAAAGAEITIIGRSQERLDRACAEVARVSGNDAVHGIAADLGELDAVNAAADELLGRHDRIDALLHNAGALTADRRTNDAGIELTVASQVLGPFLLTARLLEPLRNARPGRVITMSSGGMYTAGLTVDDLEMTPATYRGAEQYARAKRAQIVLNEMWAARVDPAEVVFHSLHPGWVDTPGVDESLPTFSKVAGPLLRTPDQGADTMIWLAADDEPLRSTGSFWLDRRRRNPHRTNTTRRTDTATRRAELWDWCVEATGVTP
jgi:NAD(P)-dependent dehydrogenase (short-subunit alcohol dehydrogenase family)